MSKEPNSDFTLFFNKHKRVFPEMVCEEVDGVSEISTEISTDELNQIIDDMDYYQAWRRGADIKMPDPTELGILLDEVIEFLKYHNKK